MGEPGEAGSARLRVALLGLFALVMVVAALVGVAFRPTPAEPSGASGSVAPDEPVVLDLTAAVQLPRLVRDPRTVNVLVTNHGPEPVRIRRVELRTDSFAPDDVPDRDVVIPAGAARALAVTLGEGRCGGQVAPPVAPATARLVVAAADPAVGPEQPVDVPVPDPEQRLAVFLHADCAAERVAEVAEVRFGPWSPEPDGRLRGSVMVERRVDRAGEVGGELIILYDVADNILFDIDTAVDDAGRREPPLGELPPGESRLVVPVVADAGRCDGHAVGEVKRHHRYRFQVWVTVGDDERLPTTVATDPEGEARMEEMLLRRCELKS